jgi:DNA-binding response OmpR family regulator
MVKNCTILYVEDDETLRFITVDNLERKGFRVVACNDGLEGYAAYLREKPDLCLLDVMLPEVDGFTLARKIRQTDQDTPIIFLTAKTLQEDKIEGLILGADDYIVKPFSIEELVLRINVFLKRTQKTATSNENRLLEFMTISLDVSNMILKSQTTEVQLTSRESELLGLFIENKHELIARETILEKIWGENDYFYGRSLDVFISKLRKYLKVDPDIRIDNIHGVGFRLTSKNQA